MRYLRHYFWIPLSISQQKHRRSLKNVDSLEKRSDIYRVSEGQIAQAFPHMIMCCHKRCDEVDVNTGSGKEI